MTPQLICLLGAECTGKTTLARALAAHFGGLYSADGLAVFCHAQGRTPQAREQAALMRSQFELEEVTLAKAREAGCRQVMCDTAPLLTAVRSEVLYSDPSLLECAIAVHARYAVTLLLQTDLSCPPGGTSAHGAALRAAIHQRLTHVLQTLHLPCIEVAGLGESRLQTAIEAVEALTG
jgi:nicotinamide riboside kinase